MKEIKYREKYSLEYRLNEANKIMQKYPNKVPIIVECDNPTEFGLEKSKFIVPCDINIGQFIMMVRNRVNIKPNENLYIFVNNTIPSTYSLIYDIYTKNKEKDNMLYITICKEATFG